MSGPCNQSTELQLVTRPSTRVLLLTQVLFASPLVKRLVEFQKKRELFWMKQPKTRFGGVMSTFLKTQKVMPETEQRPLIP